jgi:hypothetical protein
MSKYKTAKIKWKYQLSEHLVMIALGFDVPVDDFVEIYMFLKVSSK